MKYNENYLPLSILSHFGQTQIYHIKICYDIFLTVTLIFRVVFSLKALGECQFLCFYPV